MKLHMRAAPGLQSGRNAVDVLVELRSRGIQLWVENGQIRYRARKNVVRDDVLALISEYGNELMVLLQGARGPEGTGSSRIERRELHPDAPLSYQQLAHWHAYRLEHRRSQCQGLTVLRVSGHLHAEAFRLAADHLVTRHEALRTRVVVRDGVPLQHVEPSARCNLTISDLRSNCPLGEEVEVGRRIDAGILEGMDVKTGPLHALTVMQVGDSEFVVAITMEHIISDARSSSILVRDLFTAYEQVVHGSPIRLPEIETQYADYSVWQRQQAREVRRFGFANRDSRLRWPPDTRGAADAEAAWSSVSLEIDSSTKDWLAAECRRLHTTVSFALFAAYSIVLLRLCGESSAILRFQGHGRIRKEVANTIGYFAAPLYLAMQPREDGNFIDVVKNLTSEYCDAYDHADFARAEAQALRPGFTRNPAFNWIPQCDGADFTVLSGPDTLAIRHVPHAHPMWRTYDVEAEPLLELREKAHGISCEIFFSTRRHSAGSMHAFLSCWKRTTEVLLAQPTAPISVTASL